MPRAPARTAAQPPEQPELVFPPPRRPTRHQRARTRGWRKPDGAVIVDRTSRWGNPFPVAEHGRAGAISMFRSALHSPHARDVLGFTCDDVRRELRGRDLVCFCWISTPCHGDELLTVANG